MLAAWQSWPLSLHPVAFVVGGFPVTWYALLYLTGAFFAAVSFVRIARRSGLLVDAEASVEVIVSVLWGVIIGARLGYVVFYGGAEFMNEPWRIFLPYDFSRDMWIGIRGMSFHGGLIGGAFGLFLYTREARRDFFRYSDVLVQAVPIALFFGRIGNFLNLEILGRVTHKAWGMYFPGSTLPLHPVVLYEALLEGVLLFLVLNGLGRRFGTKPGYLTVSFLFLYAGIRYLAEGYRATPPPEQLVFHIFTIGQALSLAMALLGVVIILIVRKRVVYSR
jgi:phosphatidylglycerol:prolipoprotein diacylglycerol transferase